MRRKISLLAFIPVLICITAILQVSKPSKIIASTIKTTYKTEEISMLDRIFRKEMANKVEKKEKELLLTLTQEELQTFYILVFAEDGIEDEESQVAVAATVINRVLSKDFPDDLYGVINKSGAFSSVRNGKIYIMTNDPYEATIDMVSESTKKAVQRALEGEDPTEEVLREEARRLGLDEEQYAAGGALYFYNPEACTENALEERNNIQVKAEIGLHTYYKVWG